MKITWMALLALFALQAGCGKETATVRPPDAGIVNAPVPPMPPRTRISVLVLPPACQAKSNSRTMCDAALGLAGAFAESLESDPWIVPINGPLVLTAEQAALLPEPDKAVLDLARANVLARESGASHFVTGAMGGETWAWKFQVDLYAVGDEPTLVGTNGYKSPLDIIIPLAGVDVANVLEDGRKVVSAKKVLAAHAAAAKLAFAAAGHPLADATLARMAAPATRDFYSLLLLSRAYAAHFIVPEEPEEPVRKIGRPVARPTEEAPTALSLARRAWRIDRDHWTAQRFYAALLRGSGDRNLARVHYEYARKVRPNDLRTLVGLGELEVADGNPDVGRTHLRKAIDLDPTHARARHWLGAALVAGGDRAAGIAEHERARDIDPAFADPRRALIALYAEDLDYVAAVREARALVGIVTDDPLPWYLLGANLRAAGARSPDLLVEAAEAYAEASERFPDEHRLHLFRADVLKDAGRHDEARTEYVLAGVMAWYNERLKAILRHDWTWHIGGQRLADVIYATDRDMTELDRLRERFDLGMLDAIFDLRTNGAAACASGAGASSAKLAKESADAFNALAERAIADAWRIAEAWRNGEHHALTTDEFAKGNRVRKTAWRLERDWREMRTEWRRTFLPLYLRAGCASYDGEIADTDVEHVEARLATRTVEATPAPPPQYGIPISPSIPPRSAETITFFVETSRKCAAHELWLDGERLGTAAASDKTAFTATKGMHALCLVRPGGGCGKIDSYRNLFLYDSRVIPLHCGR